ncbi:MAG: pyridoxine 5'-phosphate synthase [Desulfobacterales bacterium]|jgi:pyridoxine 5-phosphate synthase
MTDLIVRIDPAARMRTGTGTGAPDPVSVAVLAEMGGADAVIAHLREDRAGIQERDLRLLREILTVPLVLEMTASNEMIGVALEIKPDRVFLVPPLWEGHSADGGLDLLVNRDQAADAVRTLADAGIPTGILIDPDPEQVKIAHRIEAESVEIDTTFLDNPSADLSRILDTAKLAQKLKLAVVVGADVSASRLKRLRSVEEIGAVVSGQGLIAAAILKGMSEAVRETTVRLARR